MVSPGRCFWTGADDEGGLLALRLLQQVMRCRERGGYLYVPRVRTSTPPGSSRFKAHRN